MECIKLNGMYTTVWNLYNDMNVYNSMNCILLYGMYTTLSNVYNCMEYIQLYEFIKF